MREINDYDTVKEYRMECTGDKQEICKNRNDSQCVLQIMFQQRKVTAWHAKATTYVTQLVTMLVRVEGLKKSTEQLEIRKTIYLW